MGATDRGAQLREQLIPIIVSETLGKDYGFDFTPVPITTQQGIIIGGYMLVLSARTGVLDVPRAAYTHIINDGWPQDPDLRRAVKTAVAGLEQMCEAARNPARGKNGATPNG